MHEAVFRIAPGGPYGDPTDGADVAVDLWCNDHCDLLSIVGADGDAVLETIADQVGIRDRLRRDGRILAITESCIRTHDETIESALARHGCLLVPPLQYVAGDKRVRVLALDPGDLSDLYRDLDGDRSVTVESKRSLDDPPEPDPLSAPADPLSALSNRQREALTLAFERGYYELPRETTTSALGDAMGISRRTAEEHLRRAEGKVLQTLLERAVTDR